ncbi:MAG: hypothetical protein IMW97_04365 [Firmicutes bacterium]|nr:hypothetical protein [Candidatus Fermentithermobacillaceae bacterium]
MTLTKVFACWSPDYEMHRGLARVRRSCDRRKFLFVFTSTTLWSEEVIHFYDGYR